MHWKNGIQRCRRYVILSLLLVNGSACWAEHEGATGPHDYQVAKLKAAQVDVAGLGLSDCSSILELSDGRAIAACRFAEKDNKNDYGLRVCILATDEPAPRLLSVSRGLGDAYTVNLQKRSNASALYKDLILADASAEYAYGAAVYHLQGDKLRYLGEIGYVLMSEESNPLSALNATTIQATKDGFKVTFTQDVFAVDKKGEYQRHTAREASMVFDGKTLHP